VVEEEEEEAGSRGVQRVLVENLRLDPQNPRLPPEFEASSGNPQRDLALYINKHYDPLRIAQSIADHRYFDSEPLIVVEDERDEDVYVVIEGNRRLTALLGLNDLSLRVLFAQENKGWNSIGSGVGPTDVPVVVVKDSTEVAPLLGFRHISGIEPWDPYAQARYIAQLVERDGHSLAEVAELVGRTKTEVSSKYRDFDILNQADGWGIDTKRARAAFGVFNNAMGRRAIRAYIDAPDPRSVDPSMYPMPESARQNLVLLLELVFGTAGGRARVITDSRQLGQLAQILADPSGRALRVLQNTRSLEEAIDAAVDPAQQFTLAVDRALSSLEKAAKIQPLQVVTENEVSLTRISRLVTHLLNMVRATKG
jgi:hypothetical protein